MRQRKKNTYMQTEIILFYLFAGLQIVSAILVVGARNPVHSVLFLILVFCNAAGLLLLVQAEFLSMLFLVVYVGAIAVLFLFVVMMLDIKVTEFDENYLRYLPLGGLIGLLFFAEVFLLLDNDVIALTNAASEGSLVQKAPEWIHWGSQLDSMHNTQVFGAYLYTYTFPFFILAGYVLLVAMIGAIVLTCTVHALERSTVEVRRQQVIEQVQKDFSQTVRRKRLL